MTDKHAATADYLRGDLSIDHQLALRTAGSRLQSDFADTFGVETIERFLHSSYDQFANRASIPNFVPLLAERFARQRLQALAKVEGKASDGRPTVLFLCTHNAGRSQMAMGFFTHLAGDAAVAWSGGSEPGIEVNPAAVEAMAERGVNISDEYPKPWTDEIVQAADVVITMGCGDACPIFPGRRYEEWILDDPAGQDVEGVRPIRDEIERRVHQLLAELEVPTQRNRTRTAHPPTEQPHRPSGHRSAGLSRASSKLRSIVEWLRAGYPDEAPRTGHSPLLALNGPIALSQKQTEQIVDELLGQPSDTVDIKVEISKVTDHLPTETQIHTIAQALEHHRKQQR